MKAIVLSCLLALTTTGHAQDDLKPGTIVHADPSKIPIKDALDQTQWGERVRIRGDFNFDGIPDLMISEDRKTFGNAGGIFNLYLGAPGGGLKYVGDIGAHPLAVHLARRRKGEGIVTIYWRFGGGQGGLGRYLVSRNSLKELPGKTIHPDDSGDPTDDALYQRFFSGTARLKAEISSTNQEGIVTWQPYDPD